MVYISKDLEANRCWRRFKVLFFRNAGHVKNIVSFTMAVWLGHLELLRAAERHILAQSRPKLQTSAGGVREGAGSEHSGTAASVSNLVAMLQYQGEYKAAEAMNCQVLE